MSVSAVLNGAGRNVSVSAETAERIRQAAAELNYRPNNLARSFRTRKTGQIAVVFQHWGGLSIERPYRVQLLSGVMQALFPHDYSLTLCPRLTRAEDPGFISDGRFDGVLWCRPDLSDGHVEALQRATVPVVMMHAPADSVPGVPSFCADNDGAMRSVVAHLKALGHRRVAFAIDPVSVRSVEGQLRYEALRTAMARAEIPPADLVLIGQTAPNMEPYAGPHRPHTALVCFSDDLASAILDACRAIAIEVPRDLSLVGFDSSPFCDRLRPPLTSVNQPVERMAFEATSHLLTLIREEEQGLPRSPMSTSTYHCGLDIRESTAPPFEPSETA